MVLALSEEGVARRKKIFAKLSSQALVFKEKSLSIPHTQAQVEEVDFKALKIKKQDWALASLGLLASRNIAISREMLVFALESRFNEKVFSLAMATVEKML